MNGHTTCSSRGTVFAPFQCLVVQVMILARFGDFGRQFVRIDMGLAAIDGIDAQGGVRLRFIVIRLPR